MESAEWSADSFCWGYQVKSAELLADSGRLAGKWLSNWDWSLPSRRQTSADSPRGTRKQVCQLLCSLGTEKQTSEGSRRRVMFLRGAVASTGRKLWPGAKA